MTTRLAAFLIAAPLAWAAALPSAAQSPLSGAEFEAYATGKTLVFYSGGQPYGAEQYFENRRVRWAFTEDVCMEGRWYEQDDQICFIYENEDGPQCWWFYRSGARLRAVFAGESGQELYEAAASEEPLGCMAPGLGV